MAIIFFAEKITFNLPHKNTYKKWIRSVAQIDKFHVQDLNYIFCSDEYLHQINLEYLDHDTYTDIITFDNSDEEKIIEGDIFVSIDRVKENASTNNIQFDEELKRVIAHGLLHLMGYKDKTSDEIMIMRKMENMSISIYPNS
ncbi:rRNA maturation RNase YbeY [Anditalea andensis]|uniref:Endoribonuclease YbeY n=1 Tax=Anditalea andensis TaxID=1048983 RepID=A0A074L157_9BACT|nr:rRNA maturation RNase YbeY [Anditalea andensis]KEO73578.1 rRNA maturation factor [Anditalea andensis]